MPLPLSEDQVIRFARSGCQYQVAFGVSCFDTATHLDHTGPSGLRCAWHMSKRALAWSDGPVMAPSFASQGRRFREDPAVPVDIGPRRAAN